MSEDYTDPEHRFKWAGLGGARPEDYGPDNDDSSAVLAAANTVRLFHPSILAGARAELVAGDYRAVHVRLGSEAPDVIDQATLHLAQRWHHIKAEAYLMGGGSESARTAVQHCETALTLGVTHDDDDSDSHIYWATLFCTYAEAKRRANEMDDETLESLRAFTSEAINSSDPNMLILLAYAQQTLGLHGAGKMRKLFADLRYSPVAPKFTLPF